MCYLGVGVSTYDACIGPMLRRHSLNQLVAASVGCCGGCQLSLLGLQHGVDVLRRLASLVGVLGSSWGRGFVGG
jgi:hypothetical protein